MKRALLTLSVLRKKRTGCNFTLVIMMLVIMLSKTASGQVPVTAVSTSYVTSASGLSYTDNGLDYLSAYVYNYKYGNSSGTAQNDLRLTSLTAGGVTYQFEVTAPFTVKMRRVNNAVVTGIRNLKFDEGTITGTTGITIAGAYDDDMEHFFIGNDNFNSGSDNIFTNQGDANDNNNNIERVDVYLQRGFFSADNSKVGFTVFDRGNTGTHDAVKVAAILSLDATGMPTSYSSIISITAATYGAIDAVAPISYVIARRDNATDAHLKATLAQVQPYGGVFIRYSDFGIPNNKKIYGYSIIPNDFAGSTSADIVNYTNAAFYPTNTDNSNGGIDLVSFTGILQNGTMTVLPVTLNSFTASLTNAKTNLTWETLNEQNFCCFDLERSNDGKSFTSIAKIAAMNTGAAIKNYTYTDDLSAVKENVCYYRLKLIDINGAFTYSSVKKVEKAGSATGSSLTVYPNPVTSNATISIPADWQNKEVRYYVVDAAGKYALTENNSNKGQSIAVNTSQLATGFYTIMATCGNASAQQKIIKQ